MAKTIIARTGHEPKTYVCKGRGLFEERFGEFEYLSGGAWLVPSVSEAGRHYVVSADGACECLGSFHHGHCCHQVATDLARVKTTTCSSCGERVLRRLVEEVTEDDELLCWFVGDRLCAGCISEGMWA